MNSISRETSPIKTNGGESSPVKKVCFSPEVEINGASEINSICPIDLKIDDSATQLKVSPTNASIKSNIKEKENTN